MVVLNECRIDDEGKSLIIEATVDSLQYYSDVFIESIIIDTDKTFSSAGPSNNPVKVIDSDNISDCTCVFTDNDLDLPAKRVKVTLSAKDLDGVDLNNDILFIYVIATGTPAACTPCGMDNTYTMGVAVNLRPIYNEAMSYINQLKDTCNIASGFIDMILRLNAFKLSLKTGNIQVAINQWHKLFKNKRNMLPLKGCGCNGIG